MRKVLKVFGVIAGLVVVAGGVTLAVFDLDSVINTQKDKYLPEISKLLGRKVRAGAVKTTLLPVLGAEIRDVVVEGRTPNEDALVQIDRIAFQVELWRAIASFGQDVELRAFVVDGMTVNLVREADGSLSYEDVVRRLASGPPEDEKPKPLDPEARAFLERLHLARVALERSRFRLVDKATGGAPVETAIDALNVELNDVYLTKPFEVHLTAAVLAQKSNFDVRVKAGPLPIGDTKVDLPLQTIAVKADGIAVGGLVPYVGRDLPIELKDTAFSADLRLDVSKGLSAPIVSEGTLQLTKLLVTKPQAGQAFDLKLAPNVTFDRMAGTVTLTNFSLSLDDMVLNATGKVDGIGGYPRFEGVKVTTEKLDLGRLQAMLPPMKAALPPGAVFEGPFAFALTATGTAEAQDVKLDIDLNGARIHLPATLEKPAGTPLQTALEAHVAPDSLELKQLRVAVGDLVLQVAGKVENFKNPTIALKGGTGRFDINGPARLLPPVAKAIPPDVRIAGQAELDFDVKKSPGSVDVHAIVGVYGADLGVPGATVRGTGRVEATAKGDPARSLALGVDAGLSGLTIEAGEAFRKPAGAPFEVKLRAQQTGARTDVPEFLVHLGPLRMHGAGALGESADVKVTLERFKVDDLATLLPAMGATPIGGATIGLSAAVQGAPGAVKADVSDLYFAKGRSSLTGKLSFENPEAPKVRFDLASPMLDVDELFPPAPEGAPDAPDEGGGALPPIVQKIDAAGSIRIARGVVRKFPFTNFVGQMTMQGGVVRFDALDLEGYEGKFSAAPTTVDLRAADPAFDVQLRMKNVAAEKLLAEQMNLPDTMSGRLSTEVQVKGRGAAWEQISKNLSGDLGMALANGRLHKLDMQQELLGGVAERIPFLKLPGGAGGTVLREMAAHFEIADGKMALRKPLVAQTGQGPMQLDGAIGLDTSLHLKGTVTLSPATIALVTANKVKPAAGIPVALKIGGTLTDPEVSGVEADALVEMLTRELAKSLGLEKLEDAKRQAEEAAMKAKAEAERRIADARAQAEAAKDKATAAARKAADDARKKAEAEAEKRKKAAKKKAEEEAKKRLKGLL